MLEENITTKKYDSSVHERHEGKVVNFVNLANMDLMELESRDQESDLESIEDTASIISTLSLKLSELGISRRLENCLEFDNIVYLGDLIHKTEKDLLCIPNFGTTNLKEARDILTSMDLQFGMYIPEWESENF